MRSTLNFNSHWQFTKPGAAPVAVTLPHTWNAADGTDGGNDYFRGICTYTKEFAAPAHADDEEVWLEFEGAAMTAIVTLNDQELTRHAGGYSTFRVNLTPRAGCAEHADCRGGQQRQPHGLPAESGLYLLWRHLPRCTYPYCTAQSLCAG
uniref:hypothetical protein n=1 Tax=Gemmiger formicilis TaxID=745368 RepID=UPI003FEE8E44